MRGALVRGLATTDCHLIRGFSTSKDYKRQYYLRNREALLKRNEENRRKRRAAKKAGKVLTTKVGRPKGEKKKRKEWKPKEKSNMDELAIQKEIEHHEREHAAWLKKMEDDSAYLTKVYLDQAQFEDRTPQATSAQRIPVDRPLQIEDLAIAVQDLGGKDLVVLDTRLKTTLFDYMMICTCETPRQMSAVARAIFNLFKERRRFHTQPTIEGLSNPQWVLFDAGWMMLHIFEKETRKKYNLEQLWGLRRDLEDDGNTAYPSAGYEEVDIVTPEELGLFLDEDDENTLGKGKKGRKRKGKGARLKQQQKQ